MLYIPLQINEMSKCFHLTECSKNNGPAYQDHFMNLNFMKMWPMKYRFIFSDDFNSILYPNIPFFTSPSNPLQSHFTARPTKHAREIYFTFYSLFDCGNQLDNKKLGISSNLGMVHNLDGANHHLFAHKLILTPCWQAILT